MRYTVNGHGLKLNSEDGFILESKLTVKAPVYTNPAVFAGEKEDAEDISWFQSGSWGTLTGSNVTTVETLSEQDYKDLVAAGYQGVLNKRTVNRANIKATSVNGDNTRGALGVIFELSENHRLFATGSDASVKANYYLSVWMRASSLIGSDTRFSAYDTKTLKQSTAGEYNWVNLDANKWIEIQFPIQYFQSSNFYLTEQGGTNPKAGVYFASILSKTDMYVDIYSAELCMTPVAVQEGETVDAKFYSGAFMTDTNLESIAVYEGKNVLSEGIDYTIENNKIVGLTKGEYEVRFYLSAKEYLDDCYVARKVVVTKPIANAVLFDDMSKNGALKVYTETNSGCTNLLTNSTGMSVSVDSISDTEYQALISAGYKGVKTSKNVQKVTFDTYSERQNVYFQFDETINHEILQKAMNSNLFDYYVSVWMKSDKIFGYDTYASIIGQTTKYVALQDIGPTLKLNNTWQEKTQWLQAHKAFGWKYKYRFQHLPIQLGILVTDI